MSILERIFGKKSVLDKPTLGQEMLALAQKSKALAEPIQELVFAIFPPGRQFMYLGNQVVVNEHYSWHDNGYGSFQMPWVGVENFNNVTGKIEVHRIYSEALYGRALNDSNDEPK